MIGKGRIITETFQRLLETIAKILSSINLRPRAKYS